MHARTRYFVIVSLLVLSVGLGAGLLAYYQRLPGSAAQHAGPDELRLLPTNATMVAYANVQDVMSSDVRRRLLVLVPQQDSRGQRELEAATGIVVERDIDRVVAGFVPGQEGDNQALLLARGRFDQVKVEATMREKGAIVEGAGDRRLIVGPGARPISVAFVEPGLMAVGSPALVRSAIELHDGGESVLANAPLMERVRLVEPGNAWAVGQFDALASRAQLPADVAGKLPPITWLSVRGDVNGGIRATVRAEVRDEAAANNLRDVVRGFVALARLQASSQPQLLTLANSVELGGIGTDVVVSFDLPVDALDTLVPQNRPR
jgi:hypothetical protein